MARNSVAVNCGAGLSITRRLPQIWQRRVNDCGPCCLYLVLQHYGLPLSFRNVISETGWHWWGTTLLDLSQAAQQLGFTTVCARVVDDNIRSIEPLPCIVHINDNHFVVLYRTGSSSVTLIDPSGGFLEMAPDSFRRVWKGIVLLLWPNRPITA